MFTAQWRKCSWLVIVFRESKEKNSKDLLKWIVHQYFEYITFFSCLNKRNIFYERSISIKQLWLEIIVLKVSPCCIYNMYNSTRLDWLWASYFLNYFEAVFFHRDGPFIKNISLSRHNEMLYIQNWWTIPSIHYRLLKLFWELRRFISFEIRAFYETYFSGI